MDAGQNSIEAGRYTAIGAPSRVAGRYVLLVAARIAAQSSSFVPHDRMIAAASTDPSPRTTRSGGLRPDWRSRRTGRRDRRKEPTTETR